MFNDSLPIILKYEGGYVDDPDDHGGATNKGITQNVYDSYRLHVLRVETRPVRSIEDSEVSDIYYRNYWLDGKCDKLPEGLNLVHFDFAVNAGIGQAAKTLQRIVGVKADGKIGPQTLAAIQAYDPEKLIHDYSIARRTFYTLLAGKPGQSKFLKGWIARTDKCETRAIEALRGTTRV